MKKEISKKAEPGILRFVSMLFLIFEKGISKTTVLGFVRILLLIFEKENRQKNCARYFEICKYAF